MNKLVREDFKPRWRNDEEYKQYLIDRYQKPIVISEQILQNNDLLEFEDIEEDGF